MKRRMNKRTCLAALLSVTLLLGMVAGCTKKEEEKAEPEVESKLVTKEVVVADKTIKSEYIPFDEPMLAESMFSARIEFVGNSLWVLLDNKLREFAIGNTLTFVRDVELPAGSGEYQELSSDVDGNLYVTGFYNPMLTIKDGEIIATNDDVGEAIIDNSGTIGVNFHSYEAPKKVTISNNKASVSEWPIFVEDEAYYFNAAGFTKNSLFSTVQELEKYTYLVRVYDKDGKEKTILGEDFSMRTASDVIETDSGFMVFDSNAGTIFLWKTDGTKIGEVACEDISEHAEGMPYTATLGDNDAVYVGIIEEDESGDNKGELFVYRLSGF